jgi:hypothetical protein
MSDGNGFALGKNGCVTTSNTDKRTRLRAELNGSGNHQDGGEYSREWFDALNGDGKTMQPNVEPVIVISAPMAERQRWLNPG